MAPSVAAAPDPLAAGSQASVLAIVSPADWGSQSPPEKAYKSRPQRSIRGLTVHHQGERWAAGSDVPAYLRRLQSWSRQARNWIDVPYHFVVAPDGQVYGARATDWAGDSNTDYDTDGQLQIMLLGNFEEQQPTAEQLHSLTVLLAHLLRLHGLSAHTIVAHRHHTAQTVCPGANLLSRFEDIRRAADGRRQALAP